MYEVPKVAYGRGLVNQNWANNSMMKIRAMIVYTSVQEMRWRMGPFANEYVLPSVIVSFRAVVQVIT